MQLTPALRLATLLAVATLSACNCQRRDPSIETPIDELQSCPEDERCATGLCDAVPGPNGEKVCLRPCTQGCRGADVCTQLADDRYACVPEKAGLCKPCVKDTDCPQPADRCINLGEQSFCGRDCSFDDSCPSSFRCADATDVDGRAVTKQCQPTSGTCECIAATAGQQMPCSASNNFGTCSGVSICRPPEGYTACSARTPTGEVCNGLDDNCNGMTDEDLADIVCGLGECRRSVAACVNGSTQLCTAGTPGTETCNGRDDDCDGTVDNGFDTQTNVLHCGACNQACVLTNATPKCEASSCAIARCTAGWTDLDHVASNGCEYPCVRSDGGVEVCDGLDNDCNGLVDDGFDLVTDPTNCGQCNLVCSLPGTSVATYACVARVCGIGTCAPGRGNCNQAYADGCEVDLGADVNHCGQCGVACVTPNATPACAAGQCAIALCDPHFGNCNGQVADGCEVNTNTSVANCGSCGNACSASNATSSCSNGSCAFACLANWWDADGQTANGCEYACIKTAGGTEACDSIDNDCDNRIDEDFDLTSDARNCGACNRACSAPFATTTCSASSCGITACNAGRANCNGVYVDGCEVTTGTDLNNCGACNNRCSAANGSPSCTAGSCGIAACTPGFLDCNNQVADGCEINSNTSVSNCGACNRQCAAANATSSCTSGVCGIAACLPGYVNLNGLLSDGCEYFCTPSNGGVEACDGRDNDCNGQTDETFTLASDTNNCGACGNVCSAPNVTVPRCVASACGVQQCANGFANCNGAFGDGCEINTNTSVSNCGACNRQCAPANASPVCLSGACGIGACLPGYVNLNGLVSDGCEYFCTPSNGGVEACDGLDNNCNGQVDETFTLASDTNNCGACGNVCSAPNVTVPRCLASACGVQQCANGFANCNNAFADGCEINTNTSLTNCGSCGTVCTTPNATPVCTNGGCQVGACTGTFLNCNGVVSDGCEVNVNGNVDACGACGVVCPTRANATRTCGTNVCGYTCTAGFVDLDGAPGNGCEYACAASGVDVPDDASGDQDCDGIDGEAARAIFVSPAGNDGNLGTRAAPKRTVQAAINAASATVNHVYVSTGIYDEALVLRDGISVFGGYSQANNWARNTSLYPVTLRNAVVSGGREVAVSGANLTTLTTLAYLTIRASDTATPGASTYGLHCVNCTGLTLRTNTIIAGAAGAGSAGSNGSAGANGTNGDPGVGGSCDGAAGGGGTGGTSTCGRAGGNGGNGGAEGSNNGQIGGTGQVGTTGGTVGGSCNASSFLCTGGGCTAGGGGAGAPGSAGGAGSDGSGGTCSMAGNFLVCAAGVNGADGTPGNGGGGGGGGGGQGGPCVNDGGGNGAGGGGSGGCAGTRATAGTGGGSSFAVFLVNSNGVVISNCTLSSGSAGNGGAGGTGGPGGIAGGGGTGATSCTGEVGRGGNGGAGGNGGRGGHAGGGAGGLSYALFKVGSTPMVTSVTYTHGNAGAGGSSPGNAGAVGTAADFN